MISPNNTFEEIYTKLVEYFDNSCRLVWVINPDERSVIVYHDPGPSRLLKMTDSLDGEDVIPGFSFPVAELFAQFDF